MKKYPIIAQPKNEIVVYQPNETMRLEVSLSKDSAWLPQQRIAELFGVQKAAISKHLKNIFASGELNRTATVSKMETVQTEGARSVVRSIEMFNLDVIIAVGYRVNSMMATQFRIWATSVLKEYMLRGIAVNRQHDALAAEMDRRLANHEQRLAAVQQKVDFVVESALPAPEMVFMEGAFLTAHDAIRKIIKAAKKRLVLIDNYIDERVLTLLSERRKGVACHVYGKNAAAVLFGRKEKIDYPQLEVKMGWFRGTTDREFRDIRHEQGNVFELIEESMAFCFKHLNLSAKINGKIERDDELEIPADALREVLINAFAHRSYEDSGRTVYLAIYDDRVEIKNPGRLPAEFDVAHLYSPPVRNSVLRNEKIARVLYLRKTIETWGRGFTRIADECKRVGMPLPTTTVEYGNVLTVFQRPDWVRTGTTTQIAGIQSEITGTNPQITGTRSAITGTTTQITGTKWVIKYGDPFAHLPKMRRDARENAETVLHEIISDNNATLAQICARTGMALRTINNALFTLRDQGIIAVQDLDHESSIFTGIVEKTVVGDDPQKNPQKNPQKIMDAMRSNPSITRNELAEVVGMTPEGVKSAISLLKAAGRIRRVGPDKGGHWEVLEAK